MGLLGIRAFFFSDFSPSRCSPRLYKACTGEQVPVLGTYPAACDWPRPRPHTQPCDQYRDAVLHRTSTVGPKWCQRRLVPPAKAAGHSRSHFLRNMRKCRQAQVRGAGTARLAERGKNHPGPARAHDACRKP